MNSGTFTLVAPGVSVSGMIISAMFRDEGLLLAVSEF